MGGRAAFAAVRMPRVRGGLLSGHAHKSKRSAMTAIGAAPCWSLPSANHPRLRVENFHNDGDTVVSVAAGEFGAFG